MYVNNYDHADDVVTVVIGNGANRYYKVLIAWNTYDP